MKKKLLAPALAGVTALALVGGVGLATALQTHDVTLSVDGAARTLSVREDTVADVLELEGVEVGAHDVVLPAAGTQVSDGLEISVQHAYPLQLTVDGSTREVWTTARTVGEALGQLNLDDADSKLSASRSASITRDGLTLDVVTAKDVTLVAGGKSQPVTLAGTVADLLDAQGITPDADDIVTPAATTSLTDGLEVKYVAVEVSTSTKDVAIAFDKQSKKTSELDKGTTKVQTKGVDGLKRETWQTVTHDGKVVSSKKTAEEVVKKAIDQVTLVGTKTAPKASSDSSSTTGSSSSNLSPAVGNTCKASYYWDPQPTASGERFNTWDFTAAHKTLPFGTRVKVTNKANGKSTIVRINDRGPYVAGRCLDLSTAAMKAIGGTSAGVVTVTWEKVG